MKTRTCFSAVPASALLLAASSLTIALADPLAFDPKTGGTPGSVQVYGQVVNYTQYTAVAYVAKPNAPARQVMNIFVPHNATQQSAIYMGLKTGGYNHAETYVPTDVTAENINQSSSGTQGVGVAHAASVLLSKGLVVVAPAGRGKDDRVTMNGVTSEIGNAPAALVDLKAAVRYLKYNDKVMLGDANKIIVNGTSGGGGMSSMLGASGDSPMFDADLKSIGAAPGSDSVFASSPFCPIIDLDNANMEYEYLFYKSGVPGWGGHAYTPEDLRLNLEGAKMFTAFVNGLGLKDPATGKPLALNSYSADPAMGGSYKDYLIKLLGASATKFMQDSKFVNSDGTLNDAGQAYMTTKGRGGRGGRGGVPPAQDGLAAPAATRGRGAPTEAGRQGGQPAPAGGGQVGGRVGGRGGRGGGAPLPDLAANLAPADFISWNSATRSATLTDFPKFVQFMGRSRAVFAFDNGFYEVGNENDLFNNMPALVTQSLDTGGWSHFDVNLGQVMTNAGVAGTKPYASTYNYVVPESVLRSAAMMNPLYFVADLGTIKDIKVNPYAAVAYRSSKPAKYWRIRVGALDALSSPFVSMNLATALANSGAQVDYKIWWNTGHAGSYDNTDMIAWIMSLPGVPREVTKQK